MSKNIVVTAGHSMKEKWYKSQIKDVTIYIEKREENGNEVWSGAFPFDKKDLTIFVNPTFQERKNADYDYSYVALSKNISMKYFSLATFEDVSTKSDSVFIAGYPNDKTNSKGLVCEQLWLKGDKIGNVLNETNVLLYSIYTRRGDSGAPVWVKNNQGYYLIGIHGNGVYGNGH